MTIRKTLLFAFLFVSLGPLMVLTGLGYVKVRTAMQNEIQQSLAVQASTLSADVDKMLFERLQNAATWNHLEVMQDIRIDDVDKRLSNFLAQLKAGYSGVYRAIYCTDSAGRVIASSEPALLGRYLPAGAPWLHTALPGGEVTLEAPRAAAGQPPVLAIHTAIPSKFGSGNLGRLTLLFDWSQMDALADQAAKAGQTVALLDQHGVAIAVSRAGRRRGALMSPMFAAWPRGDVDNGVEIRDGAPFLRAAVIAGFDHSSGYQHFAGFGWTALIVQPRDEALAPVHQMVRALLVLVGAAVLITIGIAFWVSRAIARPILTLTDFTRDFARARRLPVPRSKVGEVRELGAAFAQLMRDIEDSEQKLVRASKLAVVGEMAAAIAHEVRTPLGILRSSAQILKRETHLSPEGYELADFIDSETERLNRLVSAMLDSARPRPPQFRRADLHELVNRSVALLQAQARKKDADIAVQLAAADPALDCDGEQITQVMLNLLLNALQVLPPGGRIEIASRDAGDAIVLEIADSGPGIPEQERQRVFEAFFFRREGGIGLGLAIVQQIVAAHGGAIAVRAGPLGGALFSVRLPRRHGEEL